MEIGEDEEMQVQQQLLLKKRFTDCVYFLASPLTCKMGLECEYRHNDIARLNPRDCWYWLAGSCLNLACAFRHPPLEGCTEALSGSADPHHGLPLPIKKSNVPCFFYFSGFCYKGHRCSFLHGPDGNTLTGETGKAETEVNDVVPLEKKYIGNYKESKPPGGHPNACPTAQNEHGKSKRDFSEPVTNVVESFSPHTSADPFVEAAVESPSSLPSSECFMEREYHPCIDQNSDEKVDCLVEREEFLESSPGFDVLVEDESKHLNYEDDLNYLAAIQEEGLELDAPYAGYGQEDLTENGYLNPEHGSHFECDVYDHLDNAKACDDMDEALLYPRESVFNRLSTQERRAVQIEMKSAVKRGMDLREILERRRLGDDCFSIKNVSSRLIGRIKKNPRWRDSSIKIITLHNHIDKRGRLRQSYRQRSRERKFGKQLFRSSGVSGKSAAKRKSSARECCVFTGPKNLDQIREERSRSKDFQGPRPLSEILKDKRRLCSVVDGYSNSS